MNSRQEQRYLRIFQDRFYWLAAAIDERSYTLNISGSTANVYTVQINRRRNQIRCDCPDGKGWARRNHCVCKHCCFVLCKVLRIYPPTIGLCDLEFWKTLRFTADDMTRIDQAMQRLLQDGSKYQSEELIHRFHQLQQQHESVSFEPEPSKLASIDREQDECLICFDLLFDDKKTDQIAGCPVCKNLVHRACMDKWLKSSSSSTCVYCRSDVWSRWTNNKKQQQRSSFNDYICLEKN
jgi:hypothetical protein